MRYRLIVTERVERQIDDSLEYLVNRLKNPEAASHLIFGIDKIYDRLEDNPYQFADCRDPFLRKNDYKEAVISDMDYIIIFRIEEDTVYVVGFFHQLENYKDKVR